eukprot:3930708-Karenia_brevis.AAC.1
MNACHVFLECAILPRDLGYDHGVKCCGEALATFSENTSSVLLYDPDNYIWVANGGNTHCIDYIAVSQCYAFAVGKPSVWH